LQAIVCRAGQYFTGNSGATGQSDILQAAYQAFELLTFCYYNSSQAHVNTQRFFHAPNTAIPERVGLTKTTQRVGLTNTAIQMSNRRANDRAAAENSMQ
jgi:hypothetical protein